MRMTELIPNSPIAVQKSRRSAKGRVLTSGDAGKILPLKYEWLHREDGVQSGKIRMNVEMMESTEMLMMQNEAVFKALSFIREIANIVGDEDDRHFSRYFKRTTGQRWLMPRRSRHSKAIWLIAY